MVKDFDISPESTARIAGREILATLAAGVLYPFGLGRPKRRTARAREQRTIVFVHGYLGNRSAFLPLKGYLKAHGVKTTLSYEYESGLGIESAARGLRDFLKKNVRGGRIDLVCHSLGGLVARVYLQELSGARRVDNCVTLGTPHRGTYNAYWLASRVGRELRPDSSLLARLEASRENAKSVRFLAVVGGSDNIILPRIFAAHDPEHVHVAGVGHLGLLFSPRMFRAVLDRVG